jgi:CRP-like cAMP-binding protein
MSRQSYAHLSIFSGLSEDQFDLLKPILELRKYKCSQVVFEQGEIAEHLYILVKGEVAVRYKPYDGPALTVARIQPGGVFGWSSALGRDTYSSGAVCEEVCQVLRVSGQRLHQLCEQYPDTGVELLERLACVIAERLRNTHSGVFTMLSQGIELNGKSSKKE